MAKRVRSNRARRHSYNGDCMTRYNFDQVIERRGTGSAKWELFEEDVLPLWVADMDFRVPDAVIAALHERIDHGIFGYPQVSQSLRDIICQRVESLYAWQIKADQIRFVPAIGFALSSIVRAFTEPGDRVLIQTPIYPPFLSAPAVFDRQIITSDLVEVRDGDEIRYEIDFDDFEMTIAAQKPKIFLLCNPHNPVGRVFTRDELERMADICLRHGVIICSDEIHCELVHAGHQHIPTATLSPAIAGCTVTLMAPSKTFSLAGLTCGYAIVQDKDLYTQLEAGLKGVVPFVNIMGLTAAEAAYRDGQPWLDALLPYLTANRDYMVDYVQRHLPGVVTTRPEGTYLAWFNCREAGLPDNDPYTFFLEKARVGLNNGRDFGESGKGFVRLNFACPRPTLTAALDRMCTALKKA